MSQKTFNFATGIIFAVIGLVHLIRSVLDWEVLVSGVSIPIGVSVVGFLVAAFLSYTAFTLHGGQ